VALALNGKLLPGDRIQFTVSQAHARQTGNAALVLWSSTGLSRWILPGGNVLNLTFDGCTVSGLFQSALFSGVIDASGTALTPSLPAPALPPGLRLFAAAVTLAPDQQVVSVTAPLVLTTE
jgi:hypothetical protein